MYVRHGTIGLAEIVNRQKNYDITVKVTMQPLDALL